MPSWKQLYLATIGETRPLELRILIAETERAIFLRLKEIAEQPDLAAERIELDNAATTVKIMSREIAASGNHDTQ